MLDLPYNVLAVRSFWQALGLRTMVANALANANIDSLEALAKTSEIDLWRIGGLGKVGREDIAALLLRHRQEAAAQPGLEASSDADLVMELLRRGYRIDRPDHA